MFEIKLNVSRIVVLSGNGPDKVILHTDLPDGCWPYTGKATMELQTAADGGADYVREHFKRDPDEIISVGARR